MALLQDGAGRVGGALLLDIRTGRFVAVRSRATLSAMGGGPTMYRVFACSADKASDGLALALEAGAPLRDMEMIHGTNEHMTLDNLTRMVGFYERLVATAAS